MLPPLLSKFRLVAEPPHVVNDGCSVEMPTPIHLRSSSFCSKLSNGQMYQNHLVQLICMSSIRLGLPLFERNDNISLRLDIYDASVSYRTIPSGPKSKYTSFDEYRMNHL